MKEEIIEEVDITKGPSLSQEIDPKIEISNKIPEPETHLIPENSDTPVKNEKESLKNEIQVFEKDTSSIVEINSWDVYRIVCEKIKSLKLIMKKIQDTFSPIEKRQREALEETRNQKSNLLDPLKLKYDKWDRGLSKFYRDEQEKKKRAELEAQEEAHKKADEQNKENSKMLKKVGRTEEAKQILQKKPVAAPIVRPKVEKPKGVYHQTRYYAEVIDPNLVPREYCIPDEKKLNKLAGATEGKMNIPGVVFRSHTKTITRTKSSYK